MSRRRVLMTAYACEPGLGSEAGIGWNWVAQASRFDEVWVITRANNRAAIEVALRQQPQPHVHWVFFDLPRAVCFWKRGPRGARLYYYLWQCSIYKLARRLHARVRFDLVHHVTFGAYWMPTWIGRLNVPFVWGPVGGGECGPESLQRTFSLQGRAYEHLRDIVRNLAERLPAIRSAARSARLALATTEETAARLRVLGASTVEVLSHVALSIADIERLANVPERTCGPLRLVSIGRLLHWKGIHLGLEAFARLRVTLPDAEYWIVGVGPERERLQRLADRLGLGQSVRFLGAVSRREVFEVIAECDALVHPSLHDSGGYVCAEAMAAGRPVICLDLGGPGLLVSDDSGIRIPAGTPERTIASLAAAMIRLASDPQLRHRLGSGAKQRARQSLSWERNGVLLDRLYEAVVDSRSEPIRVCR